MHDLNLAGDINFRSDRYFIAQAAEACAYCGQRTRLVAIALPPAHEAWVAVEADDPTDHPDAAAGGQAAERTRAAVNLTDAPAAAPDAPGILDAPDALDAPGTLDARTHESLSATSVEGAVSGVWQPGRCNAFLFHIAYLPDPVLERLRRLAPHYQWAAADAPLGSYWSNHCEHCRSRFDDQELFCEPDGAFLPTSPERAARIRLLAVRESIVVAAAGVAPEPEFFALMQRM